MAPSRDSSSFQPSTNPNLRSPTRTSDLVHLPSPSKDHGNENKFSVLFPHLPPLNSIIHAIEHKQEGSLLLDVCRALQWARYPDFLPPQVVEYCKAILDKSTTVHSTDTQTTKPMPVTPTPRPSTSDRNATAVSTTAFNTSSDCGSSTLSDPIGNTTLPAPPTSSHHPLPPHPGPSDSSPTSPPTGPASGLPSTTTPPNSPSSSTVSTTSPGSPSGSGSSSKSSSTITALPTSSAPSDPSSPISTLDPPDSSTDHSPDSSIIFNTSFPLGDFSSALSPAESSTALVGPFAFPNQPESSTTESDTRETASSSSRLSSIPLTSDVTGSSLKGSSQITTQVPTHLVSSSNSPSLVITPSSSGDAASASTSTSAPNFFSRTSTVAGTFTAVGVVVVAAAVGVLVIFRLRRRKDRSRYRDSQLVPQVDPDGIPQNNVANSVGKGPPMRQASTQTNSSGRSLTSRQSTLPILPEEEEIRTEDPFATMPQPLIQTPGGRRSWNAEPDDVDPIDPDFVWSSNDAESDSLGSVSTKSTRQMTTPELLASDPATRAAMGWILADERGLTPVEEEDDEQALLGSRRRGR